MIELVRTLGVIPRDIADTESHLFADIESHDFVCCRTSATFKGYSPVEVSQLPRSRYEVGRRTRDSVRSSSSSRHKSPTSPWRRRATIGSPSTCSSCGVDRAMRVNIEHARRCPAGTDVFGATWLAQLAALGLLRASFVPPKPLRELRILTRSWVTFVGDRKPNVE